MNTSEYKLNKHISKLYVEHACQISSPGQVAKELALESSRISDLKGGRRQLTVEQSEIIKTIYGIPSTSEGYWIEAELISLSELHKSFVDNGLALHFARLVEMLSSASFIKKVLDRIWVNEKYISGYISPYNILESEKRKSIEFKNTRLIKECKLALFNRLLTEQQFHKWCDLSMSLIKQLPDKQANRVFGEILNANDIVTAKVENGKISWGTPSFEPLSLNKILSSLLEGSYFKSYEMNDGFIQTFEELFTIHKIKKLIDNDTYAHMIANHDEFRFGNNIQFKALPNKELVVVGKCVWDSEESMSLQEFIKSSSAVGWSSGIRYDYYSESEAMVTDCVNHIGAKVFYTEQYQYLVEVKFFEDAHSIIEKRCLLVKIENRQNLFEDLISIFDYFKLDHTYTLKEIKQAIAAKGGYIPSAQYID